MAKAKTKESVYRSTADIDAALGEMIALELEAQHKTVRIRQKMAALQQEMVAEAGEIPGKTKAIEDQIKLYCQAHPEVFGDKQTLDLNNGSVSFREGNPSVKIAGKHDEDGALEKCRELNYPQFVATSPRLDKEAILRAVREEQITAEELANLWMRVEQRTTWTVKPNVPEEIKGILDETETAIKAGKKKKAAA